MRAERFSLPRAVREELEQCLPRASRRDFLKSSGALVISVGVRAAPGASALLAGAGPVMAQ